MAKFRLELFDGRRYNVDLPKVKDLDDFKFYYTGFVSQKFIMVDKNTMLAVSAIALVTRVEDE